MGLKQYNFNHKTGFAAVILISIAISFCFFSLAYMAEGMGWLSEYDEDSNDLYLDVGWNWIRASGIVFVIALVLFGFAYSLLSKCKAQKSLPWKGRLDWNQNKALLALVSLSVSFTFFLNSGIYWIEARKWVYGGIASGNIWFLDEASAWVTSATTMSIIGILLSATGWVLIVMSWKRIRK